MQTVSRPLRTAAKGSSSTRRAAISSRFGAKPSAKISEAEMLHEPGRAPAPPPPPTGKWRSAPRAAGGAGRRRAGSRRPRHFRSGWPQSRLSSVRAAESPRPPGAPQSACLCQARRKAAPPPSPASRARSSSPSRRSARPRCSCVNARSRGVRASSRGRQGSRQEEEPSLPRRAPPLEHTRGFAAQGVPQARHGARAVAALSSSKSSASMPGRGAKPCKSSRMASSSIHK